MIIFVLIWAILFFTLCRLRKNTVVLWGSFKFLAWGHLLHPHLDFFKPKLLLRNLFLGKSLRWEWASIPDKTKLRAWSCECWYFFCTIMIKKSLCNSLFWYLWTLKPSMVQYSCLNVLFHLKYLWLVICYLKMLICLAWHELACFSI